MLRRLKNLVLRVVGYPAAVAGVIEAALALALAFGAPGLSHHAIALILAAVTAGFGLLGGLLSEQATLSSLVGFGKAALALVVGYGVTITPDQVASIMTLVALIGGFFLHTQSSPKRRLEGPPQTG
ncbi:MAG: hypothetical protein ACRDQA_02435 [Nocardioidaceae bacterium]